MRKIVKATVAQLSDWRLEVLHLFGNVILLGAVALWLNIPDARTWQLALSSICAIVIAFAFGWMHCGTLAHGFCNESTFADIRKSVRRIPLFLVLFAILLCLMNRSSSISDHSWQISGYLFTKIPKPLASHIGEVRLNAWIEAVVMLLKLFLLPALLLPFLSACSALGLRVAAMKSAARLYVCWKYWFSVVFAAVVGIWLPNVLLGWTPGHGLALEAISMGARLIAAYILIVWAWIAVSAMVGACLREIAAGNTSGKSIA